MRKRIFFFLFFMAAAMLTACFLIVVAALYEQSVLTQEEKLGQALRTAQSIAETEKKLDLAAAALPSFRLTQIASDGRVLFDSRHDPEDMDDHASRSEVREAEAEGFGRSIRYSHTLLEETAYLARRMPDGSVLRISESRATALSIAYDLVGWFILSAAVLIGISLLVSRRIAKSIVAPIDSLDLEHPLKNSIYDELKPMLRRLARQRGKIDEQVAAMKRRADEFDHIVGAMEEGLILLDTAGRILSINAAACGIFGAKIQSSGQSFRETVQDGDMQNALELAMNEGRANLQLEHGGRIYRIDISRIMSGDHIVGSVVLACDITERAESERRRKEFTANVSHELKTPLQSIIGASELMAAGMVKPEDMQGFSEKIYREGQRMASLLSDIIRLASMDEGASVPMAELNLAEIAAETADRFKEAASSAEVDLSCTAGEAHITGDRALITELIGNLAENAVKYNRHGGSVRIETGIAEGRPFVTVADTGIGIAEKDHERIFERFYRVDKSRSRQTGGTGLGLSIVKHAAEIHGAEISMHSVLGEGTEITVLFPPISE